jgi:glyoxalase family protein
MAEQHSIRGLHHVTAIASGAQANVDFYTRVLGLRLVKRTVNFDAPDTYHFYYGDAAGAPGSLLTFFPFSDAAPGRVGTGMAEATAFAVPEAAFDSWMIRLAENGHNFEGPIVRFGRRMLSLRDPDGLQIELVAQPGLVSTASDVNWLDPPIPKDQAIRHLHSVTLYVEAPERTARLLVDTFGYEAVGEEGGRQRFLRGDDPANIIDVLCQPDRMHGRMGAGSVHHVAFRVRDRTEQLYWREAVLARGLDVTPVLDRQYFYSIYFREPGGVLFEIATDPPGFATDEEPDKLGTALKLPPWLEPQRVQIERRLPPLRVSGASLA